MLKTILVASAGSPFGAAAVEQGLQWARPFDALLVGLGIIDPAAICRPEAVPIGGMVFKEELDEHRLADARHKVDQLLERFSLRCTEAGVASKLLEDTGPPHEVIRREAQRYDLVVTAPQVCFHFQNQQAADGTLRDIVKHSPRPIVVVPEKPRSGRSAVIAYDGSLQAARSLQAFEQSGLASKTAEIHVLSVHTDQVEAARCAERAVEFLRFHEIMARPHPISSPDPGTIILEKMETLDAGLLVMGAYGQPTLKEFLFGSVTRTVLQSGSVPLFLDH